MNQPMVSGVAAIALAAMYSVAASAGVEYEAEVRVYQALTNISGNSSQTLPCSTGDIVHLIEEQLDGVKLTMKGQDLTWNDAKQPNYPLIAYVAWLHLVFPPKDPTGSNETKSPAEYFEMNDGNWLLRKATTAPGLKIEFSLTPESGSEDVFDSDYYFEFSYIKSREPLPGVTSLDVGKPVIETIVSKGKWQFRLGEWSCLRLSVPSKGRLYVFVRTTPVDPNHPLLP